MFVLPQRILLIVKQSITKRWSSNQILSKGRKPSLFNPKLSFRSPPILVPRLTKRLEYVKGGLTQKIIKVVKKERIFDTEQVKKNNNSVTSSSEKNMSEHEDFSKNCEITVTFSEASIQNIAILENNIEPNLKKENINKQTLTSSCCLKEMNKDLKESWLKMKNQAYQNVPTSTSTSKNNINSSVPPMPWFGLDIGGTLSKLVFFEPKDGIVEKTENETQLLKNITKKLLNNSTYDKCGHRDVDKQIDNIKIQNRVGTLHFIRFPTNKMNNFLELAKEKGMVNGVSTICATGGGAFKFEENFKTTLNMKLCKFDELDSLIRGLLFTINLNNECYLWSRCPKNKYSTQNYTSQDKIYPFIVVNIGSGVNILAVRGLNNYERIFGTSIGGGTFLGLCSLLTNCNTFNEAIELAARGDNMKVDKLVRDIYGGDYSKFELPGELIASSFGHMNSKEKRAKISHEDLARATLVTVTNNIASIARLCALNEKIYKVYFVGNFLRDNPIAMKLLSHGMNYWSNDSQNAIFLNHEGYFGAIGCLLSFNKIYKE